MASFTFDPRQVAFYEAEGWRAYYDRRWLSLLRLLVVLNQTQFHIPFPLSLVAAYYITRASMLYVPVDHDAPRVLAYLMAFYRLASRFSGLSFDAARVARAELHYYEIHRKLVDEVDKRELKDAFVNLHCALFGLTPGAAQESALARTEAVVLVDGITHHHSVDVEGDWGRIRSALQRCYASVQREQEAARGGGTPGG
jgi:hypothetical protein